ncbi:hypothetical protein PQX77_006807 [Marasmius sp. AFHP31]|nr:hypothetical protein PQX77_006807 [Marasmius sp. AFHP31]
MTIRASPRKGNPTERAKQLKTATARRPRRCLKCPGPDYPLQKDCTEHSNRAVARARTQVSQDSPTALANSSALPPTTNLPVEHDPVLSHAPDTPCGLSLDNVHPPPTIALQQGSEPHFGSYPQDVRSSPSSSPNPFDPDSQDLGATADLLGSTLPPPFNNFQAPSTPSRSNASSSSNTFQFSEPLQGIASPGRSSTSYNSSPSPSSPTRSARRNRVARTLVGGVRQRPTRLKPTFGLMSAKKGTATYGAINSGLEKHVSANYTESDVVRTGALVGRVEKSEVNRRFTRSLDRILLKCERLADETDGWLFIAAQHPSVQGEYVHWTSPAMAAELPPHARDRFNATSSALFQALKTARRQNVADIELQATKARAERDAAQSSLAEKEAIIERLSAHLRSQGMEMDAVLQLQDD